MDSQSVLNFAKALVLVEESIEVIKNCTFQGHTPDLADCYPDPGLKNIAKGLKYQIEASCNRYEEK